MSCVTDFTGGEDGLRFDALSDVDRVVQTLTMNGLLISISNLRDSGRSSLKA